MGVKISKRYFSYTLRPKGFKFALKCLPSGPHKTTLGIFENLNFRFYDFFFENFKFSIVPYGEDKTLNYLENERP